MKQISSMILNKILYIYPEKKVAKKIFSVKKNV